MKLLMSDGTILPVNENGEWLMLRGDEIVIKEFPDRYIAQLRLPAEEDDSESQAAGGYVYHTVGEAERPASCARPAPVVV